MGLAINFSFINATDLPQFNSIQVGSHKTYLRFSIPLRPGENEIYYTARPGTILIKGLKTVSSQRLQMPRKATSFIQGICITRDGIFINFCHKNLYVKEAYVLDLKDIKKSFIILNIASKGVGGIINGPSKILVKKNDAPFAEQTIKNGYKPQGSEKALPEALVDALKFHPLLMRKPYQPTIVIDPGHGGHDPGSISCHKRYEKDVTLAAALAISKHLKSSGRYRVVLTRDRDCFIAKRKRFAIARKAKADFFISLHADSHPSAKMEGVSIYTLSREATDLEAAMLAQRENACEFVSVFDLKPEHNDVKDILINISQKDTKRLSLRVAQALHENLRKSLGTNVLTLRAANIAVLKAPDIPSVLIELGFLSNARDEARLHQPEFQKKVAFAIKNALDKFFKPKLTI